MKALAIEAACAEAADHEDAGESDISSTPVFSDRQAVHCIAVAAVLLHSLVLSILVLHATLFTCLNTQKTLECISTMLVFSDSQAAPL